MVVVVAVLVPIRVPAVVCPKLLLFYGFYVYPTARAMKLCCKNDGCFLKSQPPNKKRIRIRQQPRVNATCFTKQRWPCDGTSLLRQEGDAESVMKLLKDSDGRVKLEDFQVPARGNNGFP